MTKEQLLHGAKLANVLEYLVENWGWDFMYAEVDIKCFVFDPSINSSLKFLRNKKFEWARGEVDDLYVHCKREEAAARASGDWGKFYYSDGQWLPVHK